MAQAEDCQGFVFTSEAKEASYEYWRTASNEAIFECLKHHGISTAFETGVAPLNLAAYTRSDATVLEYLLTEGANPNHTDKFGFAPLHDAAHGESSPKAIALLLDAGAQVDAVTNRGKRP